ncbi:hypothetical protein NC653_013179 [Populus alba x Populus x berolinensis]|uniref:Uncharacterized protein n=1 Tax=Populus alba x Populus x berolinensis TaxID=444605 RepID=A0AAD6QTQ8_9ROSI|nr:hypothetical protein NC653_013179 [Populus alba x Populus x berolinensis]
MEILLGTSKLVQCHAINPVLNRFIKKYDGCRDLRFTSELTNLMGHLRSHRHQGVLVMSLLVVVVDERLSAMGRRLETGGGVRLLVTGC